MNETLERGFTVLLYITILTVQGLVNICYQPGVILYLLGQSVQPLHVLQVLLEVQLVQMVRMVLKALEDQSRQRDLQGLVHHEVQLIQQYQVDHALHGYQVHLEVLEDLLGQSLPVVQLVPEGPMVQMDQEVQSLLVGQQGHSGRWFLKE